MSHGEEGFLTTKEGDKVLLDEIFTMFNNINCPNLAGKPKLFFIQSCRDDPITGPAEDLGIRLSYSLENKIDSDETDGAGQYSLSDNNNSSCHLSNKSQLYLKNSASSPSLPVDSNPKIFYHIPSLCDMLIGYPTQRGFIAYRKPEIGSWYMNAIVQIFSKHSHDTDLCAMLNMVNSLISNEVTNTGKKQMSEYTSKLTKPYFYFFPGLASDPTEQVEDEVEASSEIETGSGYFECNTKHLNSIDNLMSKKRKRACYESAESAGSFYLNVGEQADSNFIKSKADEMCLRTEHIEFLSDKARAYWKHIAREMELNESQIVEIDRSAMISNKLKMVFNLWLKRCAQSNENKLNYFGDFYFKKIIEILTVCRLNKIKNEFLEAFPIEIR